MRLICPNCGAQYEVPDDAIPAAGRDVQCSNCGQTWFQAPGLAARPASTLDEAEGWDEGSRVEGDDEEADDLAEIEEIRAAPPPGQRSTVTPEVAGILRAEAERESRARAEEAERRALPPEPAPRAERPASAGPQPMVGPGPQGAATERGPSSRRERLPDIEEINSSLRPAMDRRPREAPAAAPDAARGRGFRLGFATALLVGALLVLPYAFARPISAVLPGASEMLGAYVGAVDEGRRWLDLWLRDALQRGDAS